MVDEARLSDLKTFRDRWQKLLDEATRLRDKLLDDQSKGYRMLDGNGVDRLQDKIMEVDKAVRQLQAICVFSEDRINRAMAGEDV